MLPLTPGEPGETRTQATPTDRSSARGTARNASQKGRPLAPAFAAGELIAGRFRIVRFLGQGGMGQVFEAVDLDLKLNIALKIIRPEISDRAHMVESFKREVHLARRVTHPNVCRIFDLSQHRSPAIAWGQGGGPILFLTMELIRGETLARRIRRQGPYAPTQALAILRPLADALDAAHRAGVVHRDFKGSNVLLVEAGGEERAVVMDFGLARSRESECERLTQRPGNTPPTPGGCVGTPGYVAPEALAGQPIGSAADIYSFGVVIHLMLTGSLPCKTQDAARGATLSPDLDPLWASAIARCLQPEPGDRCATAGEVIESLTCRQTGTAPRLPRPRHTPEEPEEKLVWTPTLIACALALGLTAGLWVTTMKDTFLGWEDRWIDACFYLTPTRLPKHPLLLVLIDDATLKHHPEPLVAMADEMGARLARALSLGATGVGIDLLLPASWGRSETFSDLLLRYPERVALAAFTPPQGPVIGPEAVAGISAAALGPKRAGELFGFANLEPELDGVVRRSRALAPTLDAAAQQSFALRMARILLARSANLAPPTGHYLEQIMHHEPMLQDPYRIDFRLRWTQIETLSWHAFAAAMEENPARFRDRFIVVGATYSGSGDDAYRVPHPRALPAEIPGPFLQSLALHTLLDGAPLGPLGRSWTWILASLLATCAAAAVSAPRPLLLNVALAGLWSLVCLGAFAYFGLLLPLAPSLAAMLLAASTAALWKWLRRRQLRRRLPKRRRPSMATLLVVAFLPCLPPPPAMAQAVEKAEVVEEVSAAIVLWLSGEAFAHPPEGHRATEPWQPLELLDRLVPGSQLRTGEKARLVLVFHQGQRFALGAASRAEVLTDGLKLKAGTLQPLESVPALAELPRLAEPGRLSGAGRIRHEQPSAGTLGGLFPNSTTILSEAAILRFQIPDGATRYRVEVVDSEGREVFATDTTRTPLSRQGTHPPNPGDGLGNQTRAEIRVPIPDHSLQPGSTYYWRVLLPLKTIQAGAFFTVLATEDRDIHDQIKAQAAAGDLSLSLLLAEVESHFGLRQKACETLARIHHQGPSSAVEQRLLARFHCRKGQARS